MLSRKIRYIDETDYNLNFCLSRDISNLGYYKTLTDEVNEAIGTLEEITLFDSTVINVEPPIVDSNPFIITGYTNSRLSDVRAYSETNPYQVGINNVIEVTAEFVRYIIDGIEFKTFLDDVEITIYSFTSKGLDLASTYNKPIIKEDDNPFLEKPVVKSLINIDRNPTTVFDRHYRLSLVKNLSLFRKYPNNYFNL
jgi:hypothetical protein